MFKLASCCKISPGSALTCRYVVLSSSLIYDRMYMPGLWDYLVDTQWIKQFNDCQYLQNPIQSAAFSPGGEVVVLGASNGSWYVLNTSDQTIVFEGQDGDEAHQVSLSIATHRIFYFFLFLVFFISFCFLVSLTISFYLVDFFLKLVT